MNQFLTLIGLRFAAAEDEAAYRAAASAAALPLQRALLWLGLTAILAYAIRDVSVADQVGYAPLFFRVFFLLPVLAIGIALSYVESARAQFQSIMASLIVVTIAGVGILSLLYPHNDAHDPGSSARTMSTIIITLAVMTLSGLRFEQAVAAGLTAVLFWLLGSVAKSLPPGLYPTLALNVATAFAVSTCVVYWLERAQRRAFAAQRELDEGRAREAARVFTILPDHAAARFAKGEHPIADAFLEAFVVVADIAGFSELSKRIGPKETVRVLDRVFTAIDEIAVKHKLERVKTGGDRFILIGGTAPGLSSDPASALEAAQEMLTIVARAGEEYEVPLAIRVGIHLGPLIGGVTGRERPAYDYWGDTLEIAGRLETSGEPGRILCSEVIFWRLGKEWAFAPHGPMEVRGFATLQTYMLTGRAGSGS